MKIIIFLFLLGIQGAAGVTHSLKYFYTASSQVPNFPEFVVVGMVDEVQMIHYDSDTRRAEPKQDWVNEAADPQYWERETGNFLGNQQWFKANIGILNKRFNQTGGVHTFQMMYGCKLDEETKEVNGFYQYGFDGEDLISLDMKTMMWIAPRQQAFITKTKWDSDKALSAYAKNYFTQDCIDWVKKYINYGRRSLLRTDPPSVSLLQKSPSSPVSCHATGFYPDRATMFWRKDGEEIHEDVDKGEILPNTDGTFQMNVDLNISSVKPEDWSRYDCVFHLSGVKDDVITKLDKDVIRTNKDFPVAAVIGGVVVVLFLSLCIAGFLLLDSLWRRKYTDSEKSSSSDTNDEQKKMMNSNK